MRVFDTVTCLHDFFFTHYYTSLDIKHDMYCQDTIWHVVLFYFSSFIYIYTFIVFCRWAEIQIPRAFGVLSWISSCCPPPSLASMHVDSPSSRTLLPYLIHAHFLDGTTHSGHI